jgi:hypothetical protein
MRVGDNRRGMYIRYMSTASAAGRRLQPALT